MGDFLRTAGSSLMITDAGSPGDFNYPDICWLYNTTQHVQAWKILRVNVGNFLVQVMEELMRKGVLLYLLLANLQELVEHMKVGGSLGCSDHEMVEFMIPCEGRKAINRARIWDLLRANFGLFKDLLVRIPWDKALI